MDEEESGIEELERMYSNESSEPIRISFSVIEYVTKNFCQEIGRGGFGTVYLGSLRNDVMVAVKKLDTSRDVSDKHFLGEVKCLKTVNHKNIVRFLGYCACTHGVVMEVGGEVIMAEEPKRFLCFEYAPNGNLHDYLKEKTNGCEWSICYKIIKGISQGLHYLHQKGIKHMDLKPENVLLGAQMEPKITDFGLSRNDGTQFTIVTRNFMGTFGYMPPELINERKISFKSDIYSLGIILIRLLTGSNEDIPENWHKSLTVDCGQKERCIEIARICSDNDPYKRLTISDIISKLSETETTNQNASLAIITEPGNDPTSTLYKNLKIFLARRPETRQHYRWMERLPVERPKWKLVFQVPPKFPILTGEKIRDTNGNPLEVIIVDAETGEPLLSLPDVLQIELVPLLGNFPRDNWDTDDFQRGVVDDVVDQEGKHPVLAGEYRATMWDGHATVNELMFTDHSWYCGCMFRIGVRVVPDSYHGTRILEGMTEAFMVRDHHAYKLHNNKNYKWLLAFQSQPRLPIYFGRQIRDVIGNPLEVILVDAETGLLSAPPVTELHIELVTLLPRLNDDWPADEFQRAVRKPGRGLGPYLSGDISLTMKDDGCVTVNELQYTGSRSLIHTGYIGVCVVPGSYNGPGMIRESITNIFQIQDRGKEMLTKRFPPSLGDEVWRLKCISWGGVSHRRLTENNVRNVQDFLRMLAVRPDELRAIVGDDMDDSTWSEEIISHARTCVPVGKVHAYSTAHTTIYVNSIFDLLKVELGGVERSLQQLDEAQKRLVEQALQEAYEHRHSLQEVKLTLKLAFKSQPRLPIHAGSRIVDATGNPLEIILVDAETGSPSALSMKLDIRLVPLVGDFPSYEDWSSEEFRTAIVKQRQEHEPLLKGNVDIFMKDGRVTVEELQFTDDSFWVRCRKFRIGAYLKQSGFRIVEAMTEAVEVGDLNRKHYPPVPSRCCKFRIGACLKQSCFRIVEAFKVGSYPARRSEMMDGVGQSLMPSRLGSSQSKGPGRVKRFTLEELKAATDGFSENRRIGSGSFGLVYHGTLYSGREVAIRRSEHLVRSSRLAEAPRPDRKTTFDSELTALARANHKNIVCLLGCCADAGERVLVYEFMTNGTLHDQLHSRLPLAPPLASWRGRLTIALDAARGIEYMHVYAVPPIIHRDIKSANILFDDSWTAKIADFGLSVLDDGGSPRQDQQPAGTVGYLDPEYYRLQDLTDKSDVYSFGVVLLELVSGCRVLQRYAESLTLMNVVEFAVPLILADDIARVLDPRLPSPAGDDAEAVAYVGYLAADCVGPVECDRPSMTDVVDALERAVSACSRAQLSTI